MPIHLPKPPYRLNALALPLACFLVALLASCETETYPRPRGYHRIEMPERGYQAFDSAGCPMRFEYPKYAHIKHVNPDSCFLDVHFPMFNCYWHLTTRQFNGNLKASRYAYDEYQKLVYMHAKKGAIRELPLETPHGIGTLFQLSGNVPSPLYFYFTDGKHHAVEGSFYFFTSERADSLAPVINFLREDMRHLIQSISFIK